MRYRFFFWAAAALFVCLLPRTLAATAGEVPSVHSRDNHGSSDSAAAAQGEPARTWPPQPELADAYRCFGEMYLELHEAQEAIASCGKAWGLDPASPEAAVCEARGHLALRQFAEAQRIYHHLEREHPQAAWAVLEAFHHALAAEGEAPSASALRRWVRVEEGIADPAEAGPLGLSTEVTVRPSAVRSETLSAQVAVRSIPTGEVVAAVSLLVPLGEAASAETKRAQGTATVRFTARTSIVGSTEYEVRLLEGGEDYLLHAGSVWPPQRPVVPAAFDPSANEEVP